jgi:hypothetical protein
MRVLPGLFRATLFCLIWSPSPVTNEEPPPPEPVKNVPQAVDVFTLPEAGAKGSYDSNINVVNGYLLESVELVNAATIAISKYKTDKIYRKLFSAWLGID